MIENKNWFLERLQNETGQELVLWGIFGIVVATLWFFRRFPLFAKPFIFLKKLLDRRGNPKEWQKHYEARNNEGKQKNS
jgi:hypothetical protein